MTTVVTRPDERSLRFTQVSTDNDGQLPDHPEVVTDPARSAVVIHVSLESLDGGQHIARRPLRPRARQRRQRRPRPQHKDALGPRREGRTWPARWWPAQPDQDAERTRAATSCRPAEPAHGAATAPRITLGFGRRRSGEADRAGGPGEAVATTADAYDAGWHDYLATLQPVPASAAASSAQYLASALVLAAGEDKANPGAFIASPSAPWVWGDEVKDLSRRPSAYHEVWSRDAYQFGTAL